MTLMPARAPAFSVWLMVLPSFCGLRGQSEDPRGELGIKIGELRRNGLAQEEENHRRGRRRYRNYRRPVEVEAGAVQDLFDRVPGMHALQAETTPGLVEGEVAERRHQCDRPATAIDVGRAHTGRADEIHFRDQGAPRV